MASEEFTEGSEQKRPNVQMGDPFMEKLLLEACLEAMATGAVLGIQDMGAAGLTCSTCEMGARGGLGLTVELDRVPQRETGMTSYEIMLSESQERMLLVADKQRAVEVLDVFSKWGLDASIVGEVTAEPRMRITQRGVLMADIPNQSLTDDAPVYHRPVGTWTPPVPKDPPAHVLEELKKPRDYTADLKKLLASANICDKRWVYEQYDSMVQTNTVQGPGGEAGVMRIKGSGSHGASLSPMKDREKKSAGRERGLAMALAGNGRWTYLDPKLGAMHAVAEAARKVACTGATPVSATNCLNFGNPEKPEIMAQLSAAIDGIAEACTALGTPITGGNVSLYNETKGVGIYPTPVVGIVGIIDDVTKAMPSGFSSVGEAVLVLGETSGPFDGIDHLGSSQFAKVMLDEMWGGPPQLSIESESKLNRLLARLSSEQLITSASDVSDGGLAVTLAKAAIQRGIGMRASTFRHAGAPSVCDFFSESASRVVVTCSKANIEKIKQVADSFEVGFAYELGETIEDVFHLDNGITMVRSIADGWDQDAEINCSVADLYTAYSGTLEAQIAEELVTA
jgi:phosphoribosylformylglycinamidine synthase